MSTSYLFSHDGLHDALTHLYAPPFIYEVLNRRLKSMDRHHGAVSALKVLMQPDDVKSNEYQSYESAIIDCAEMLDRTLRPDDTIGRMGIFEFLIILAPDTDGSTSHFEKSIAAISERISARWGATHRIPLTISSASSYPGDEAKDLLNRLDG